MSAHEMESFLKTWEYEADLTRQLLRTLPKDQLEFRPDPAGRSLGELAWHLAALEAIMSTIAVHRDFHARPEGLERPSGAEQIAEGYDRLHREAVERVRGIAPEDLNQTFPFVLGQTISVGRVLWIPLLHHLIHHRGQLMMLIRMAHGTPSRIYGPNREDEAAMRAAGKPA
jgi:uncharacterized damage-inducible protein DinB